MAKLSSHGNELFRYLSLKHRGLIAVMEDGVILRRTPFTGWKVYMRKKKEVPLQEWRQTKMDMKAKIPAYLFVDSIPSAQTLERWSNDGICETVTGDQVEPDGVGSDGAPSWLLVFGLI